MPDRSTSTTIRVSKKVRDELGALAAAESLTLDELLRRLARAERQRLIRQELAQHEFTRDERDIIAASLSTSVGRARR
jgi:hypothetical protein